MKSETKDTRSLDLHQFSEWPATGPCKMRKFGTTGVGALHSTSNWHSACSSDSLSQVRSVYTTERPMLRVDAQEMKIEQNPGPDAAEVWRPW